MMGIYDNYYHRSIETVANLTDIGVVTLEEMRTLPFFGVHWKGNQLKINDTKHCGTTGDCQEFVEKFLDIKYINAQATSTTWHEDKYKVRICTPEDITEELYKKGFLYFCPPANKIKFENNFDIFPSQFLGIEVMAV